MATVRLTVAERAKIEQNVRELASTVECPFASVDEAVADAQKFEEQRKQARAATGTTRYGKVPEWLFCLGLSAHAIAVFGLMSARYASADGTAYPSWNTLALDLGISKPTVGRAIQELWLAGALHKMERRDPTGRKTSTLYRLQYHRNLSF